MESFHGRLKYLDGTSMTHWRKIYPYSERIYEAQPYFYALCGLVTIIWFHNIAAVASGLIFIGTSLIVGYMRYRYRREFRQSHGLIEIPTIFRDEASPSELVELNWKDGFDCGHPVIDAQHRRLFGLCNLLIDRMARNASDNEIHEELAEIIAHVEEHFRTEETIHARTNHPLSDEHKGHHSDVLEKIKSLREQYAIHAVGGKDVVRLIAYDVIADHILKEDHKWTLVDRW